MSSLSYRDIQAYTNLSLSTISRYFNGGKLKKNTIDIIEKAINEMNYTPSNSLPVTINKNKSKLVGIIIPNLTNSPFYIELCHQVEIAFEKKGFNTLVCRYNDCTENAEYSSLKLLLDNNICALVAIPKDISNLNLVNVQNRNIPIVLLDKLSNNIKTDAVIIDNKLMTSIATEEFYSYNHRKIAILISGNSFTSRERKQGYINTMNRLNIPIKNEYIVDFSDDDCELDRKKKIKQLFEMEDRPTAIFCANYIAMLECLEVINESKLKIKKDISIIGIDNITISKITNPKLSMMIQPLEEIANSAVGLIVDKLTGKQNIHSYVTIELPTKFIQGDSVAFLENN